MATNSGLVGKHGGRSARIQRVDMRYQLRERWLASHSSYEGFIVYTSKVVFSPDFLNHQTVWCQFLFEAKGGSFCSICMGNNVFFLTQLRHVMEGFMMNCMSFSSIGISIFRTASYKQGGWNFVSIVAFKTCNRCFVQLFSPYENSTSPWGFERRMTWTMYSEQHGWPVLWMREIYWLHWRLIVNGPCVVPHSAKNMSWIFMIYNRKRRNYRVVFYSYDVYMHMFEYVYIHI